MELTQSLVEKILDGRHNSFRQAIQDDHVAGDSIAVTSDTEMLLTNNGLGVAGSTTAPDYITDRWDATNSKIALPDELDSPTYVNDISFTFDPNTASAGTITLKLYVDESGARTFATDPLIRTYASSYKSLTEAVSMITTWFLGDSTGYDAKNNGVYFTVEFSDSGILYGTYFNIYRT